MNQSEHKQLIESLRISIKRLTIDLTNDELLELIDELKQLHWTRVNIPL